MENKRIKYTTYTAGAIEAVSSNHMKSWRADLREKLASPDLTFYDPVAQEAAKVGKESKNQVEYITGLKQGGHWDRFLEEMEKIYWGHIDTTKMDRMRLLIYLFEKAKIEGNYETDLEFWGDYEAVVRSDFIIVNYPSKVKTIGTLFEIHTAYLLGIPVYLILPDSTRTEENSTLIDHVIKSGGEIFYTLNECATYIRDKYKLKEEKK